MKKSNSKLRKRHFAKITVSNQDVVQRRRAIKAVVVIVLMIAFVPVVAFAQQQSQNVNSTSSVLGAIFKESLGNWSFEQEISGGTALGESEDDSKGEAEADDKGEDETLSEIDVQKLVSDAGVKATSTPPDSFIDECFDARDKSNVLVNEQGNLISFTSAKGAQEEFNSLAQQMESNGWNAAKSGSDVQGTFVKSEGIIRWAYVSCIGVGGETCVVVQTT